MENFSANTRLTGREAGGGSGVSGAAFCSLTSAFSHVVFADANYSAYRNDNRERRDARTRNARAANRNEERTSNGEVTFVRPDPRGGRHMEGTHTARHFNRCKMWKKKKKKKDWPISS